MPTIRPARRCDKHRLHRTSSRCEASFPAQYDTTKKLQNPATPNVSSALHEQSFPNLSDSLEYTGNMDYPGFSIAYNGEVYANYADLTAAHFSNVSHDMQSSPLNAPQGQFKPNRAYEPGWLASQRRNALCHIPNDKKYPVTRNKHAEQECVTSGHIEQLTAEIDDKTALINRLRVRLQISACNEESARTDLQMAEAQQEIIRQEVQASINEIQGWKATLGGLVGMIVLYIYWCYVNGPEFAYIRNRRAQSLGLDA